MRVSTNIKSPDGKAYQVNLGQKTLLIGPNESGKSAVAEAVELAITGNVSNLLMRKNPVKQSSQLNILQHPDSAEALFAQVEFEDGGVVRWQGKQKLVSGDAADLGASVALIAELRSVLSGSANTAYEFFYNKLVGGDAAKVWKDKGAVKRRIRAELGRVDHQIETAGSIEKEDYRELLEQFMKALMLSHVKRNKEKLGTPASKEVLKSLGLLHELAALPGSATLWDELEARIASNAIYMLVIQYVEESKVLSEALSAAAAEEKEALAAMKREANLALADYCKLVSKYLPPGETFELTEANNMLFIGLRRKGATHNALSGSTEARVLAAMGAALSDCAHSVVIVDDRMWDSGTMASTMKALEKAPCHVIMMTTSKPRGRARKGWTYVDMQSAHAEVESSDDNELVVEVDFGNE
tara:strand:- start:30327 stop:31565 length:1239 start_codon:yes stop_codon:yes gene_type:complete